MMRATSALFVIASAALAIACSDGQSTEPYGGFESGPSGGTGTSTASTTPILVDVDTNKTMTAAPGDGVGIFVEYAAGGQWHVWWTCDTNKTNESCAFNIKISAKTGSISNLALAGAVQGDTIQQSDSQTINAVTMTSSNAVDVKFAADAGGTIEIDAALGGVDDSSYFFFVQDGTVNGGYTGTLTDPLRFEGNTP